MPLDTMCIFKTKIKYLQENFYKIYNIYKKIFKRFIIFTRKFTMQTLFNNEYLLLCDNFLKNYNFTTAKLNKFWVPVYNIYDFLINWETQ